MALYIRECIQCGAAFKGGPRAWYCPECRKERQKQINRESRQRQAEGKQRKIGSTGICENCGKPYIVASANQKWCPDCKDEMLKEVDRTQSLEYYYENKETINPARNTRRRAPARRCAICGRDFAAQGNKKYCSPECYEEGMKLMRPVYEVRRQAKKKEEKDPQK